MMTRWIASAVLAAGLAVSAATSISGCEREEGPAEELGEAIDNAVDDAKDAAD
jgi:hypothetical protein